MRVAVFDLDGTLADTAGDLIGAINTVAAEEGLARLDPAAERAVAGQGGRALLRRALALSGREPDEALVERLLPGFLETYAGRIARETRLFPGAEAALDRLAAEGWTLAVCTNKPEALALSLLSALGARDRFAAVTGADTLPVRKPDPRHFAETVRRAGGASGRAVLIGDTVTDRETARRAGAPCVLVSFGYADRPLAELAPEAVLDDYAALPALLSALIPAA